MTFHFRTLQHERLHYGYNWGKQYTLINRSKLGVEVVTHHHHFRTLHSLIGALDNKAITSIVSNCLFPLFSTTVQEGQYLYTTDLVTLNAKHPTTEVVIVALLR